MRCQPAARSLRLGGSLSCGAGGVKDDGQLDSTDDSGSRAIRNLSYSSTTTRNEVLHRSPAGASEANRQEVCSLKNNKHAITRWIGILPALLALAVSGAAVAQAVPLLPSFSKTFAPDTIGPGSSATLTFDVTNGTGVPVEQLAFTDTLPVDVTIAAPGNAVSTCGGTLDAPDGGGTITLSDGSVGAFSACSISVDVTSSTPGTHTNESGTLTSSAGNSGTANDDLIVTTTLPGFTKPFAPDPVPASVEAIAGHQQVTRGPWSGLDDVQQHCDWRSADRCDVHGIDHR